MRKKGKKSSQMKQSWAHIHILQQQTHIQNWFDLSNNEWNASVYSSVCRSVRNAFVNNVSTSKGGSHRREKIIMSC